jgi:CheY-like chemotaxis protein/MinD-like ATPase involved in chromosome partitioning or flagellar assembly
MAEKILIVDDDIDSLKLIGLMLQRQGYEIAAANAGGQAIAKALAETPDLIILDVMMPDMDGYEVCRRLRADTSTQHIPIIMFTAKTLVDDKVTGFEAGADDYLTKPTHPAELASRVKAVLARSMAQRRTTGDSGLLIGFLGTKGGVGTTTLSTNVAAAIGQKDATILVDVRLGQGSLGLSLGLGRSAGLANLLGRPAAEMTPRAIEGELVTHSSGIKLLLSSGRPKESQLNANPDTIVTILKGLRALARNVVVDLGSGLNRQNVRLVKEFDQIVLVVEPYRVTLNMARELLKELEGAGIGRGRTNVVLLSRSQSTLQVPWQEAEQILSHEMLAIISPAPELAFQASEAGFPIVLFQPTSIVATQMNKLSEELGNRVRALAGGLTT